MSTVIAFCTPGSLPEIGSKVCAPGVPWPPRKPKKPDRTTSGRPGKTPINLLTDPRRERVLALYAAGLPMYKIGPACHIESNSTKAILRVAGIYRGARGQNPGA